MKDFDLSFRSTSQGVGLVNGEYEALQTITDAIMTQIGEDLQYPDWGTTVKTDILGSRSRLTLIDIEESAFFAVANMNKYIIYKDSVNARYDTLNKRYILDINIESIYDGRFINNSIPIYVSKV